MSEEQTILEPIAVIPEHCTERLCEPSFLLTEAESELILLNPHQYFVEWIQVDGCLINDGSKRCDYLLQIAATKAAYLVELKGSDVDKAIEQLNLSHTRLSDHFHKNKFENKFWIISHSPSPRSTSTTADITLELRKRKIKILLGISPYELTL